ncbi:MAG: hypothetical protein KJN90_07510, partial [Gammaproteobacteria bacterium]|nr:hypothetical protein [Gammaproteobacteria bacterium]
MTAGKIDVLFINGIRDNGTVDVIRTNPRGKMVFSTGGSCHVATFVPPERINVHHFAIDCHAHQEVDINYILKHDIVFCEIADPDSHSAALKKARYLFDTLHDKIPWINDPHQLLITRREKVPELLSGIEGIVAPRTLRIKPGSIPDLKSAIETNRLSLPVLLRPAGSHGGENLVLIEHFDDLNSLDVAKYSEAFITEFFDFGSNGIYSKYRFAVVAGEPLLRHVLSNDQWMVHSEARAFTASKPELREAEAEIIKHFDQGLKLEVQDRIRQIHERIGLDYFGIDCAIKDGKLILFEVNANMNILNNNQPVPNIWEEAIDTIRNKIMNKLILPRARSSA